MEWTVWERERVKGSVYKTEDAQGPVQYEEPGQPGKTMMIQIRMWLWLNS